MNKNKHLIYDERHQIEQGLNSSLSFKAIGRDIRRDCTTIAKEVKAHIIFEKKGGSMSNIRNYDKYKHLIGTKINEWTILDVICDPNRTNTYLSVQCSCGTITELKVTEVTKNIN